MIPKKEKPCFHWKPRISSHFPELKRHNPNNNSNWSLTFLRPILHFWSVLSPYEVLLSYQYKVKRLNPSYKQPETSWGLGGKTNKSNFTGNSLCKWYLVPSYLIYPNNVRTLETPTVQTLVTSTNMLWYCVCDSAVKSKKGQYSRESRNI